MPKYQSMSCTSVGTLRVVGHVECDEPLASGARQADDKQQGGKRHAEQPRPGEDCQREAHAGRDHVTVGRVAEDG